MMSPEGHTEQVDELADGAADRHAWVRSGAFRVGDGVHRIPLPLPGDALRAVNVYAVEHPDGIVLIDSGWALSQARRRLERGLAEIDADLGMVSHILVTHVHRDHYDLGTQLRREFGSRLALGIGERPSLDVIRRTTVGDRLPFVKRLRESGAGDLARDMADSFDRRIARGEAVEHLWPMPDEWLEGDRRVELEDRTLQVVATPGHTQGHVVFVDKSAGQLFAGDHVLPHITPSIGFESVPAKSALGDYMASLGRVRGMDDVALLPAHGPVRPTTHDRIDQLLVHHEDRLDQSQQVVGLTARTAHEVASILQWTSRGRGFSELDMFNQMLAVNETAAHLDLLVRRRRLTSTTVDGVRTYAR